MNTRLHKKLFLTTLVLLFAGFQSVSAQYPGAPFTSVFPQVEALKIGTAVGVGDIVQLEYYDIMTYNDGSPANMDGANNLNGNPTLGVGGTYFDRLSSGVEPSPEERSALRSGSDVGIIDVGNADGTSKTVITAHQGNEYLLYTIEVLQSGMYTVKINYSHTSPDPKKWQLFVYNDPTDLSSPARAVANSSNSGANPVNAEATYNIDVDEPPYAYGDSEETLAFQLDKGTQLMRFRLLSSGWQTDYLTFTLQSVLSTDEEKLASNELKAFPNPANDGKFQLNKERDWSVYSILGAKIIEGKGKDIDLSPFAKGIYMLKTENETKRLIYN